MLTPKQTRIFESFMKKPYKELILDYSRKFRGYNANIKMNFSTIKINASKQ